MSKALLLIVCDFLLLSLLALARFDTDDPAKAQKTPDQTEGADPQSDLVDALKMSLEQERAARQQLDALLKQTQSNLENTQTRVQSQAEQLEQKDESLRSKEEEARRVAAQRAALEKLLNDNKARLAQMEKEAENSKTNLATLERKYQTTTASLDVLQQQFLQSQRQLESVRSNYQNSQSNIEELQKRLAAANSEARVNEQLVTALQQDLNVQVQQSAAMKQQVQQLEQTRQVLTVEKEKLSGQLQVVETEKRMTTEQLTSARQEVAAVREEKTALQEQTVQLAANVGTLATQSAQITEEIRQSRPLTPNVIFSDFTSNRVHTSFQGTRPGLFGSAKKDAVTRTILFSDGKQTYAVYHLNSTPFELTAIGTDWQTLYGTLRHGLAYTTISQLAFLDRDPRILIAPVTEKQTKELGCAVYPIAKDLFKFDEAVLVGADESYYGETSFRIDPETPGYMRMERERFGKLFGKFVPTKGDLVFSKQGELIGMMANDNYCLVFDNLAANRRLTLGPDLGQQRVPAYLSQMYYQISAKPFRLQ